MYHGTNFTEDPQNLVERDAPVRMVEASLAGIKHEGCRVDDGGPGNAPARSFKPPARNSNADLNIVDKKHFRDLTDARKIQNAKLPIMRLPAEVFELAFLYLQKNLSRWYPAGDCRQRLQFSLMGTKWTSVLHVCNHWRTIGLNCSSLWTTIAVDSRWDNRSFVQESLLRNNGRLLCVALGDRDDSDARKDVLAQLSRIQELSLFNTPIGEGSSPPADILPSSLDTLTIYKDDWMHSERQFNTLSQLLSRTPILKYVYISECHSHYLLHALKPITGLRQLEICQLVFLSRSVLQAFLDVLDNNQGLEDLAFRDVSFYRNKVDWFNPESRCADMKALRRLWIARMNAQQIASMFACLRVHGQLGLAMSIEQVNWYRMSSNCGETLASITDMFPSTSSGTYIDTMLRVKTLRFTAAKYDVDITGVGDDFAWEIENCEYPDVVRRLVDLGVAKVVEELWLGPAPLSAPSLVGRRKPTAPNPPAVFTPFFLEAVNLRELVINLKTNERLDVLEEHTGQRWLAEVLLSSSLATCTRLEVVEIDWFQEDFMNTLTNFVSGMKATGRSFQHLRLFMREGYESNSPTWRRFLDCDALRQLSLHVECTAFPFNADVRTQYRSAMQYPSVCLYRRCEGGRWEWPAWV